VFELEVDFDCQTILSSIVIIRAYKSDSVMFKRGSVISSGNLRTSLSSMSAAKAKIIVMLRNPVDLIYSKHSQMVYNCEENEEDFKKAWYLQYERKKGKFLPKNIINPEFLYYEEIGKLGEQIERLYNIFPKEQVHIILFDDFVKNTKYMYEKVLKFLDLPLLNKKEFIVINSNKAHRFKSIGNLLQKPPKILFKSIHFIEDLLGIEQLWPIDLIRKLNTKKIDRKPLDPNFRRELISVFESDIKKLEKLINKDLSFWLK